MARPWPRDHPHRSSQHKKGRREIPTALVRAAKPAAPVLSSGGYSDRDTQVAIKTFPLGYIADEALDRAASAPQGCGGRPLPRYFRIQAASAGSRRQAMPDRSPGPMRRARSGARRQRMRFRGIWMAGPLHSKCESVYPLAFPKRLFRPPMRGTVKRRANSRPEGRAKMRSWPIRRISPPLSDFVPFCSMGPS
jgi:hypothetical protein